MTEGSGAKGCGQLVAIMIGVPVALLVFGTGFLSWML